mgnify:CR=1 FL=1
MKRIIAAILSLSVGLSTSLLLSGCDLINGKPSFKSIDITGAEYARELSLKDPTGRVRSLAEFKGQVWEGSGAVATTAPASSPASSPHRLISPAAASATSAATAVIGVACLHHAAGRKPQLAVHDHRLTER